MDFVYNGNNYSTPTTLADITLRQHIDWSTWHGYNIDQRLAEIELIEDETTRELEKSLAFIDKAVKSLSFYCGIPEEEVRNNIQIGQVIAIQGASSMMLAIEERELTIEESYNWEGFTWVIKSPLESVSEDITNAEFEATQMLARHMLRLSQGDWQGLILLCAAYLRKDGEAFSPELIAEGSARLAMMETLPMNIAFGVAMFLEQSLTSFLAVINDYVNAQTGG